MTNLIDITPKRSHFSVSGIYVYLHFRKSDGLCFYIGQGRWYRGWSKDRIEWWHRTARKHGVRIEIHSSGLTKPEADKIEVDMIERYRILGHPLVNITDGGEGGNGAVRTVEQKNAISRANTKHTVYCSNGMVFNNIPSAVSWLKSDGKWKASVSAILRCGNGDRISAYGYAWSFVETPVYTPRRNKKLDRKPASDFFVAVATDRGEVFDSTASAARFLSINGYPKASSGNIVSCCKGRIKSCYGRKWRYH